MRKLYAGKLCALLLNLLFISQLKAQDNPSVLDMVKQNAGVLHLSATDVEEANISSWFLDEKPGITYVYLQQNYQKLKVFNYILSLSFKNGKLLYSSGKFVADIASKAGSAQPIVAPSLAVAKAATHLQLLPSAIQMTENTFAIDNKYLFGPSGIAKKNIEAELMWVMDDSATTLHLAWNVNIDVLNSPDWWNVCIDAISGAVVNKNNWTVYEQKKLVTDDASTTTSLVWKKKEADITKSQYAYRNFAVTNASYNVIPFPYENRISGTIAIENNPWLKAGAGNNATTFGWHYDGVTYHDSTRGNNVHAYLDAANKNTFTPPNFSAISTTPQPSLTFNFTPVFTTQPTDLNTRSFAITNLFYWNNIVHDITYQYGFNEASGNFQMDNIERGGSGNDYVRAEAQDGSGTDNANFSTPADGASGRMQMYLFAGIPAFTVSAPSNVAGNYFASESGFSTNNKLKNVGSVTGQVVYYNDNIAGTTHYACGTPGTPANSVIGKIAMIIRGGGCAGGFVEKVKNAQNAGAIAVIVVNNAAGYPITMGGTDNTITIPAVMISQADGGLLASELSNGLTVTLTASPDLDGDMDNGIVVHEYGHGISNRLTGGRLNANCLSNAEQGGEGWSDYLALMMTTNWAMAALTDGANPRPMGTYAIGQPANGPGIRTYPYSTNMTVNPLTYANVATNTEVHAIGEVWCAAIWDMTWNIIQQEGSITPDIYNATSTGGNVIALKLVMEGMRLQPCRPGFLDARDAILAADSILYNGAHKCAIWNAFARRGMGYSAVQGLSTSATDQAAAFNVPANVLLTKSATPTRLNSGGQITITLNSSCQCQVPLNGYTLKDTIPAGFNYVGSTGGTVSGNVVTFSGINFTTAQQTKTHSVTLQAIDAGCAIDTAINDNRDSKLVGGLTASAITGTTQWVPGTTRFNSATTSWVAANVAGTRDFVLTSSAFTAKPLSVLSFWHYFDTENYIDGGKVEYSTDGGTIWLDASSYIIKNGYNATMVTASPWGAGQKAFSGSSYGQGASQFINTIVDLSSFNAQSVRIRFHMRTNATNASSATYEGWFIDDVMELNGCGGIVKAALYDAGNVRIDTAAIPLLVTPAIGLPVTLVSFAARQAGQEVLLNWQTKEELNLQGFTVEHSTDGTTWAALSTVVAKLQTENNYQLYHRRPSVVNYYRLRIIDRDGKYKYSPVRKVIFAGKDEFIVDIIPNPASQQTNLYFRRSMLAPTIAVIDFAGRRLKQVKLNGTVSSYRLATGDLPVGSYIIQIDAGTERLTEKLVIAR